MHLPSILALLEHTGGSAFDEMLRLFGIASIVFAFFKGIKLLITQPAAPPHPASAQASAPASAPASDPAAAPASAGLPQPAPVAVEGIAPDILAVIAAAVATVTGPSRRIVVIKQQPSHWEKAGRQSVLTSHRIR